MDSPQPPSSPEGPNLEKQTPTEPAYTPPPQASLPVSGVAAEERNMAMFCHLGSLAGYIIPLGNIVLPVILWQVNKDKMPFVNDQGKESVNFQISITIYILASIVLGFVTCGAGFVVTAGLGIFALVMIILASIEVSKGVAYRYPLCLRLIQ